METVIIDAEWEELPTKQSEVEVNTKTSNWLDKIIIIEYSYLGVIFGLKILSMLFISECE